MASVTFPAGLGGDGSTVTDDANATTGLANGGHRTRFIPALSQFVTCANGGVTQATAQVGLATTQATNAATSATLASQWAITLNALVASTDYSAKEWAVGTTVPSGSAKTWAQTALNAPGTSATSTTSLTIGAGSQSLTLAQTGKSFVVGQYVQIVSTASTGNWMVGAITSFTSGTGAMTVNVTNTGGSGTIASWTVAPATPSGLPSQSGQSGKFLRTDGSNASWQYATPALNVVTGTTQTAVADGHYILTNASASTLTLPASPSAGDVVWVTVGNGRTDNILARNGSNLMSLAEDMTINNPNASLQLRYINSTLGWRFL